MGDQCAIHIPTKLIGNFCYKIWMVYSAQNISPLSYSELLSMICLLWKMHVLLCLRNSAQPNFSSIREKSKPGSSVRNNLSSLKCIWFPQAYMTLNKVESGKFFSYMSSLLHPRVQYEDKQNRALSYSKFKDVSGSDPKNTVINQ